ncbi:arylsulfatase I-like [Dermacentor andersoni]|uniref:arylsulfatase I-like n=1 Tax=Dermacentor andersoni TaxID=34620 RepID=UPI003B3A9A84
MTSHGVLWPCALALLHVMYAQMQARPPHIVVIIADDLGWNDVSWNNKKMHTPNLEKLAREGVILDQHYVLPTCTPTRAALLTGRYPFKLGIQGHGIRPLEPSGLPLGVTTLAEELKRRQYSTHAFGKWHLGYCDWSLTPTRRGFETFRGFYAGAQDYFNHTVSGGKTSPQANGYDYRDCDNVDYSAKGIYSTTLIANHVLETIDDNFKRNGSMFLYVAFQAVHAPLQAPSDYRAMCSSHANKKRVKICELLAVMDHAVGLIVKKLKEVKMWRNSLVVFMSDNGGQVLYGGNNWPLRGNKNTLYEGGTRVPAFVAGPLLKRSGYRSSSIVHLVDWFPTLLSVAGALENSALEEIDGIDQWSAMRDGAETGPRAEFIYNLDCKKGKLVGAIREGDLKLFLRPSSAFSGWYPEPEDNSARVETVGNASSSALYNITGLCHAQLKDGCKKGTLRACGEDYIPYAKTSHLEYSGSLFEKQCKTFKEQIACSIQFCKNCLDGLSKAATLLPLEALEDNIDVICINGSKQYVGKEVYCNC